MDDEEAFLELVRGNNQGELKPLEIGLHALHYVDSRQGQDGKGIQAYADAIGKDRSRISRYRSAAKVLTSCDIARGGEVLEKTEHLAAIHKAPEPDWPWLVSELLKEEWSVKDTEAAVKAVSTVGDIPEWLTSWLDPDKWNGAAIKKLS